MRGRGYRAVSEADWAGYGINFAECDQCYTLWPLATLKRVDDADGRWCPDCRADLVPPRVPQDR